MSAASYKMTEMIPLTSAHLIDRSKDAIFELVCVIKWSILSFPVYITKKRQICNDCNRLNCIALNDEAYGLPKERWFRSMLFSVNASRNPI